MSAHFSNQPNNNSGEVATISGLLKTGLVMFLMCLTTCPATGAVAEDEKSADSTPSLSESDAHYIIRIDSLTVDDMTLFDTLDVILESGGHDVGGFMLKFGFSSKYLQLLEVIPGEIPDSCNWDLFRSIPINTAGREGLPDVLWQVTALAKSTLDSTRPVCYGLDRPASLFRVILSSASLSEVPDTAAPIFFFWEYCRDNILSDPSGDRMMVSDTVIDLYLADPQARSDEFPTRTGTPQSCIHPRRKNAPTRRIEFRNGGVEFKFSLGKASENDPDSSDTRQAP